MKDGDTNEREGWGFCFQAQSCVKPLTGKDAVYTLMWRWLHSGTCLWEVQGPLTWSLRNIDSSMKAHDCVLQWLRCAWPGRVYIPVTCHFLLAVSNKEAGHLVQLYLQKSPPSSFYNSDIICPMRSASLPCREAVQDKIGTFVRNSEGSAGTVVTRGGCATWKSMFLFPLFFTSTEMLSSSPIN